MRKIIATLAFAALVATGLIVAVVTPAQATTCTILRCPPIPDGPPCGITGQCKISRIIGPHRTHR